jgi:hypothetical protein
VRKISGGPEQISMFAQKSPIYNVVKCLFVDRFDYKERIRIDWNQMGKLRVALLANLKKNAPHWEGMAPDQWDDLDSESTWKRWWRPCGPVGMNVNF